MRNGVYPIADPRELRILRDLTDKVAAARLGLTNREYKIMYWAAAGIPVHQIGLTLKISPHTVQKHLVRILEKAGVLPGRKT